MKTASSKQTTAASASFDSVELLPLPFFVLDSDLRFLATNAAYRNLVGKKSITNERFEEVQARATNGYVIENLQRALKDQTVITVEDFWNESKSWYEYRIDPGPEGLRVLVSQVTERRLYENQMIRAEEQARQMIEGCALGIAQLGLDGRWQSFNSRALQILGTTAEELVGHSIYDMSYESQKDVERFAEVISGRRETLSSERQLLRPDGREIWVHVRLSLVRDENRRPKYFVLAFDDIAERKEAEESLQFALEAAQMGDWDYDATSDLTRRSSKFNQIFGYPNAPNDWRYADFIHHTHPDDRHKLDQQFKAALKSGENYIIELRIVWPNRKVRWVSMRGRVYLNRQGRAVRMAGLVMDITREKLAEHDLQSAKLSAEDANREKSYFLANMSHEIRTPLGAILGFADALKDESLSGQERHRYLEILSRNGRNLGNLIDDILDLSKVEAGHLEIEKTRVDAVELVEDVAALLKVKADSKGLKLQVQTDENLPRYVATDAIRMRQILLNVIGNAVKFTSEGEVRIEVSVAEPRGPEKVGRLVFLISDTGPGVSREQAQKLFHPFVQADNTTTRKYGGTGLGLALSRRLARAMSGDLLLEKSTPGEGATFRFWIPAVDNLPAEKAQPGKILTETSRLPAPPKEVTSLKGLRILLADDSPDNQELIQRMLDLKGADTELADDGAQAVDRALHADYDVILMDMQMPRLDGYEATRELRKAGYVMPIIALTANAMRHDREKCIEAGCTEYLSKPIDPAKLYRLMSDILQTSHH